MAHSTDTTGLDLTDADAYDVPPDAAARRCEHCGRPFPSAHLRDLHLGVSHWPALSESEREAYTDAAETERADLHRFRIVALGTLVALYFGLLFAYAIFA